MKRIHEVLEKTLLQFGHGNTPEQRLRNQRNIVSVRKMIDAARFPEQVEKKQEVRMKTVIDVLTVMGKASAREIAARMQIEPLDVLNLLREQEEQCRVVQLNGFWEVVDPVAGRPAKAPASAPAATVSRSKNAKSTAKKTLRGDVTVPVKEVIVALLTENGSMDTVALASAAGRDPRGLASNLCLMAKRGYIQKIGQGKGAKWGLPDDRTVPAAPEFAELPDIEITPKVAVPVVTAEEPGRTQVETLPVSVPELKKTSQSMQVPSLREISTQIRKAKSGLKGLVKLRDAVREVNRHRRALRLFNGNGG